MQCVEQLRLWRQAGDDDGDEQQFEEVAVEVMVNTASWGGLALATAEVAMGVVAHAGLGDCRGARSSCCMAFMPLLLLSVLDDPSSSSKTSLDDVAEWKGLGGCWSEAPFTLEAAAASEVAVVSDSCSLGADLIVQESLLLLQLRAAGAGGEAGCMLRAKV
jgi:hypothetical protein